MKTRQSKPHSTLTMPGLDYGFDRKTAVMSAPDFNDNLRAADIMACAYGEMPNKDVGSVIPIISLVGTNPEPLKNAFLQFQSWIDATGPDALNVEILYNSDGGYQIGFGPEYKNLLWRTVGVDHLSSPMLYGLTYIKKIDTRNPILDQLARYSENPVAPVLLAGAYYAGVGRPARGPHPADIQPIVGCPNLLLLKLPIYKTATEVPKYSGLMSCAATLPTEEELAESRKLFEEQALKFNVINDTREKRLASLMPVTLHMLRTFSPIQQKLIALEKQGVDRWQLEQAIINLRLWSLTDQKSRVRFQNANDLRKAIHNFAELDSPDFTTIADDRDAIIGQVLRDARSLLKRVGVRAPATLAECQSELRSKGFVKSAASAR